MLKYCKLTLLVIIVNAFSISHNVVPPILILFFTKVFFILEFNRVLASFIRTQSSSIMTHSPYVIGILPEFLLTILKF
jgi:hypothetical protein